MKWEFDTIDAEEAPAGPQSPGERLDLDPGVDDQDVLLAGCQAEREQSTQQIRRPP